MAGHLSRRLLIGDFDGHVRPYLESAHRSFSSPPRVRYIGPSFSSPSRDRHTGLSRLRLDSVDRKVVVDLDSGPVVFVLVVSFLGIKPPNSASLFCLFSCHPFFFSLSG